MKQLLIASVVLMMSHFAAAAPLGEGSNNLTGELGFSQSVLNFGVDYEKRSGPLGVGGYFLFSSEKSSDTFSKNQVIAFGAMIPIHVFDDARMDLAVKPGFGVLMIKGLNNVSDQTTVGPALKVSALFKVAPAMKVGLEYTELYNWLADKAGNKFDYANAVIEFVF